MSVPTETKMAAAEIKRDLPDLLLKLGDLFAVLKTIYKDDPTKKQEMESFEKRVETMRQEVAQLP